MGTSFLAPNSGDCCQIEPRSAPGMIQCWKEKINVKRLATETIKLHHFREEQYKKFVTTRRQFWNKYLTTLSFVLVRMVCNTKLQIKFMINYRKKTFFYFKGGTKMQGLNILINCESRIGNSDRWSHQLWELNMEIIENNISRNHLFKKGLNPNKIELKCFTIRLIEGIGKFRYKKRSWFKILSQVT